MVHRVSKKKMVVSPQTFFDNLRDRCRVFREKRGLSQDQLGSDIGCSRAAISNFESGKSLLGEDALNKLIAILLGSASGIANRLRITVDALENPAIPEEVKKEELKKLIASFIGSDDLFRA